MELVEADNKSLDSTHTILENRKVYKLVQIIESGNENSETNSSTHSKEPGPTNCSFVIQINSVDLMSIEEEKEFQEKNLIKQSSFVKPKTKKK
jgi:hypothetical protein